MARLILWKVLVKPKVALLPFQIGLFALGESNLPCRSWSIREAGVHSSDEESIAGLLIS